MSGFRVSGLGFGVQGLGFRVRVSGHRELTVGVWGFRDSPVAGSAVHLESPL